MNVLKNFVTYTKLRKKKPYLDANFMFPKYLYVNEPLIQGSLLFGWDRDDINSSWTGCPFGYCNGNQSGRNYNTTKNCFK